MRDIADIQADFELLDDWEDRYRYLIELGRELPTLPENERTEANKVRGCVSQVWLVSERDGRQPPRLTFRGTSDAHIVQGLVAIALSMFSGRTPAEIDAIDAEAVFGGLGLQEHLTPQRSNGLTSMVNRIKSDAREALAA